MTEFGDLKKFSMNSDKHFLTLLSLQIKSNNLFDVFKDPDNSF